MGRGNFKVLFVVSRSRHVADSRTPGLKILFIDINPQNRRALTAEVIINMFLSKFKPFFLSTVG